MEERKPRDEDDAPTEPEDWIGAAEVRPNIEANSGIGSNMEFHVFRSSTDHTLFGVLDCVDGAALPNCPNGGSWEFFKKFAETGQPRIGSKKKPPAGILKAKVII